MEYYRTSVAVRAPVDTLFNFFADPQNLSKVSPKGIGLRIDPVELPLKIGSRVRLRFRCGLVPIRWELSIKSLKKGDRFIDWQEKGPFREWRHTHLFSRTGNMTTVVDMVEYELPYGFLGPMLNALVIRPAISSYFRYRQARLVEIFGGEGAGAGRAEGRGEARREGRGERGDSEGRGERGDGRRREGRRERGERGEREGRRERGEREGREAQGERRERSKRGGRGRGPGREREREPRDREREREPRESRDREPRDREREPRVPREREPRDRARERRDREPVRDSSAGLAARPSAPRRGPGEEGEWVDENLARAAERILQREKRERLRDREGAEIDDGEPVRARRAIDEFSVDEERAEGAGAGADAEEGPRRRRRRGGRGRRGRGRDEGERRDTREPQPAGSAQLIDDAAADQDSYDSFSEDVEAQPGVFTEDRVEEDQEVRASDREAADGGESEGAGRRRERREDRGEGRRERGGRRRGGRDRGERDRERGGYRSRGPRGGDDADAGSEAPERERIGIVPIYYPGSSFDPEQVTSDSAPSDATRHTESLTGHSALILPGPRRRRTWGRGPQRIALHPPELPKTGAGDAPHTPPSPDTMPSTTDNR